jgi:hypothetical protein
VAFAAVALLLGGCGSNEEGAHPAVDASSTSSMTASHSQPVNHGKRAATRHSPTTPVPALGHQTKFAGCHVRGQLPDRTCTPGAVFPSAMVSQICTPGYSSSVRDVPESVKEQVYAEYGVEWHAPGSYEVDHLVSLELGGSNAVANLWPEISPGYHEKDGIENRLHDAVCAGAISLLAAQEEIARDWRHTYAGAPTNLSAAPSASAPLRPPSPPASSTPTDFCSTHRCIPSFDEGHGTIVQCADAEWSHSGGRRGVCSGHGGPR